MLLSSVTDPIRYVVHGYMHELVDDLQCREFVVLRGLLRIFRGYRHVASMFSTVAAFMTGTHWCLSEKICLIFRWTYNTLVVNAQWLYDRPT